MLYLGLYRKVFITKILFMAVDNATYITCAAVAQLHHASCKYLSVLGIQSKIIFSDV